MPSCRNSMDSNNTLSVLQWNCRGFRQKQGELHSWIEKLKIRPDIIALQEPGKNPKLYGYTTHQVSPTTAFLTRKDLLASQEDANDISITLRIGSGKEHLYVTNVYSPPKDDLSAIGTCLHPLNSKRKHILMGDFNAPHTAWGYSKNTKKGQRLLTMIQNHQYILHNDLKEPTRLGNSVERDTTPDLTFCSKGIGIRWQHTQEYLNSDHAIISLIISTTPQRIKWKTARITEWDKVHAMRTEKNVRGYPNVDYRSP